MKSFCCSVSVELRELLRARFGNNTIERLTTGQRDGGEGEIEGVLEVVFVTCPLEK